MAEKEEPAGAELPELDMQVIRDLPELDKLVSEQDKKLASCEEGLRRWRKYADDYRALRERLSTLPERVTHPVTVPLGPLAFAPGRLVHTNELLVLLGDNWFAKTSAHAATGIVDRRLEQCNKTLADLEKEKELFSNWREQTAAIQENDRDVQEIREPLDEEAEQKWKEEHRRRVSEHKRREAELRQKVTDQTDVMARLDALEKLEELRDEIDRLSDGDDGSGDGGGGGGTADSAEETDSDGSVIIRESPEPLDSDDDSRPASPAAEPPPDGAVRRKRVSFSGQPGCINTVHVYDRDEPTGSGGGGGDGDGDGEGEDGDGEKAAAKEDSPTPVRSRESTPVSILKPSDGRPGSPLPPASSASAAAAAAAAAAGAAWAADEAAEAIAAAAAAAAGRVRWLGGGDSVPIVSAEQEEPPTPPIADPERPDLSKVFSYRIEERDTAPDAAPAADNAPPKRPLSRFRASRSQL